MTPAHDPFVGRWTLRRADSKFDPNHKPRSATLVFERTADGHYLMTAEGVSEKGDKVVERPQRMVPDGQPHPIPDMYGLTAVCTQPDPATLRTEARREDGSVVGEGTYVVSPDRAWLTATTTGYDTQLRQFRQETTWARS